LPVSNKAGRTFAAGPKSTDPTSPLLATDIFLLPAVEHHCAFQRGLVTQRDVPILRRQFGQLWQLAQNFSRTHAGNLTPMEAAGKPCNAADFQRPDFFPGEWELKFNHGKII
jgi:hypothetical protein